MENPTEPPATFEEVGRDGNNDGDDEEEMGVQPPQNEPAVEGGLYNEQDLQEQEEHLHSEHRENLISIRQQQEKKERELREFYEQRDQQWQKIAEMKNNQLGSLPSTPRGACRVLYRLCYRLEQVTSS